MRESEKVAGHFERNEWENLLHYVPDEEIALYADKYLFGEYTKDKSSNIVEQSQLDEMVNLFLSFSLAKKEEILNNLRKI